MDLFPVHQLPHPHVGTCPLGPFSSKDLCWSTSYINSSCSNTLGKEQDPKITTKRSVSWKVMAMGQRILDRRVLKIGSKRSKTQQQWGTFFGFDSQKGEATFPSSVFCPPCHSRPAGRTPGMGGWWARSSALGADCLYIILMISVFTWCLKVCQNK